jgi:hypothetical protein
MTTTPNYAAERIEELKALTATLESTAITTPGTRMLTMSDEQVVALLFLVRAEARDVEKQAKESKEFQAAFDRLCATA